MASIYEKQCKVHGNQKLRSIPARNTCLCWPIRYRSLGVPEPQAPWLVTLGSYPHLSQVSLYWETHWAERVVLWKKWRYKLRMITQKNNQYFLYQAVTLNADDMHYMIPFTDCELLEGMVDSLLQMVRHGLLLLPLILWHTNSELSTSEKWKDIVPLSQ